MTFWCSLIGAFSIGACRVFYAATCVFRDEPHARIYRRELVVFKLRGLPKKKVAAAIFSPMPKFLCLPGYLQSGKIFAEKSSGLRKLLTKKLGYELDFIDPPTLINSKEDLPFVLAADESEANEKWNQIVEGNMNRCWWIHTEDGQHKGFAEAVEYVKDHIAKNGPYDGIIGFSQGAAMTAAITNTIPELVPGHGPFKISVMFSGFAFTLPVNPDDTTATLNSIADLKEYESKVHLVENYKNYFTTPADLPTTIVSVFGSEDVVVPPIRSEYLNLLFPLEVKTFKHDGGHYLPNKKQFLNPIVECFKDAIENSN